MLLSPSCNCPALPIVQVTGRSLTRDSRCQRNTDAQATPWPRGLLVEAPPAPKPWRGRTWSNDNITWRTRTSFTYNSNLSTDESSSVESIADWSGGGGGGVGEGGGDAGGRGIGKVRGCGDGVAGGGGGGGEGVKSCGGGGGGESVGCGLKFGVAGGASNNGTTGEKSSSPSCAIASAGESALLNGRSGGKNVRDGGCSGDAANLCNATGSSSCDRGVPDEGSRMQRREAVINCCGRDASGSGRVGVADGDGDSTGVLEGRGTVNVLRHDLPPLAPVPRTGAFRQQHRRAQSAVDTRTVAPAPPQATLDTSAKDGAGAGKTSSALLPAGGKISPGVCGASTVGVVGGVTAVGVCLVTPLADASSPRAAGVGCEGANGESGAGGGGGTAAARMGEQIPESMEGGRGSSNGVSGTGTGASAAAVGREGGAGGFAGGKVATNGDGATAVESTAVADKEVNSTAPIDQEADSKVEIDRETGRNGERVPSMDGMMIGTRCGVSAGAGAGAGSEGDDVEVMKSIMSCETVRTYPTRAAIRQWRHMFLP